MAEAGQNRPRHDLDALVGVSVLHSVIMFDYLSTMEDSLQVEVVSSSKRRLSGRDVSALVVVMSAQMVCWGETIP